MLTENAVERDFLERPPGRALRRRQARAQRDGDAAAGVEALEVRALEPATAAALAGRDRGSRRGAVAGARRTRARGARRGAPAPRGSSRISALTDASTTSSPRDRRDQLVERRAAPRRARSSPSSAATNVDEAGVDQRSVAALAAPS